MESLISCSSISELWERFVQTGYSGRTSPEFSRLETMRSSSSSIRFKTSGMALRGECLTLNSSEWHSDAAVCFLSDTLDVGGGATAVLFEQDSVRGNTQTSKQKREELAAAAQDGARKGSVGLAFTENQRNEVRYVGGDGEVAGCIQAVQRGDCKNETLIYETRAVTQFGDEIAGTLIARHDSSPCVDRGMNVVCMASGQANAEIGVGGVVPTLTLLHEAPIVCHGPATTRTYSPPCVQPTETSSSSTTSQSTAEGSSSIRGGPNDVICVADDAANAAIDSNLAGTLKPSGGGAFIAMHRTGSTW